MKTFLEGKGYKVAGTGNTDAYTYTTTEIHGKTAMKDAIANLQADLKDTYTLGTVAADLSASASADVQVMSGNNFLMKYKALFLDIDGTNGHSRHPESSVCRCYESHSAGA